LWGRSRNVGRRTHPAAVVKGIGAVVVRRHGVFFVSALRRLAEISGSGVDQQQVAMAIGVVILIRVMDVGGADEGGALEQGQEVVGILGGLRGQLMAEGGHETDLRDECVGDGTRLGDTGPPDDGWNTMATIINVPLQAAQRMG
jgi:hypothetical protein